MKKGIVVKPENKERIQDALHKAEGRARERTVTADMVFRTAENEIKSIKETYNVPKRYLKGLVVRYFPSVETFPNAYFELGIPMGTYFTLRFNANGTASLIDCGRDRAYRTAINRRRMVEEFPESLQTEIIVRFTKSYL